jgi:hypothetical protein
LVQNHAFAFPMHSSEANVGPHSLADDYSPSQISQLCGLSSVFLKLEKGVTYKPGK